MIHDDSRCSIVDQKLEEKEKEYSEKISELTIALHTLIEAQKNTTKNVDILTSDVKHLTTAITNYEAVSKRVEDLESSRTWGYRLIIGTLIAGAITLLIKHSIIP